MHVEFTRDNAFCCEGPRIPKISADDFLQNEANIAALAELHDKASYQYTLL
jgi:hypothetical protein